MKMNIFTIQEIYLIPFDYILFCLCHMKIWLRRVRYISCVVKIVKFIPVFIFHIVNSLQHSIWHWFSCESGNNIINSLQARESWWSAVCTVTWSLWRRWQSLDTWAKQVSFWRLKSIVSASAFSPSKTIHLKFLKRLLVGLFLYLVFEIACSW